MSPLACSLLACVALFSAADAAPPVTPDRYCSSLQLGKRTEDTVYFTETLTGGISTLPDKCSRPGNRLVGEFISVCNVPYSKPTITIIPEAMSEDEIIPNFGLINIECPSDVPGCNKLDVHVIQYCQIRTAPH